MSRDDFRGDTGGQNQSYFGQSDDGLADLDLHHNLGESGLMGMGHVSAMDSFHSRITAGSGARSPSSEHLSEDGEEMFGQLNEKEIEIDNNLNTKPQDSEYSNKQAILNPLCKNQPVLCLLFTEFVPNLLENSLKVNHMTFSMLIEQILLYSTNKQRDLSMANFIISELNLIFGWIDQKLKANITR